LACFPLCATAQQPGQKVFASAEDASNALVAAAENNDEKSMINLLGSDGKEIVSSGDDTEDARNRANFVLAYREMHRLVVEPDGTTTLYVGAKNWPTPIPLVHKGRAWYFDTDAGKKEVLYRRIGRNELSTIRVCQELVAAEKDYHRTAAGDPQSPIGPLVASAVAEGYSNGKEMEQTPYRGYFFHILTEQGEHAPGGAKSYIVDGKMTGGFAFVAYPAKYRSSGVMTFIVASDGIVFQKDLGKGTGVAAKAMKRFDPDASWTKAENGPGETARQQRTP
jgi:hypothetical protein